MDFQEQNQLQNESYSKKITISDVADALGVSKTTVSRAISGKGRVGINTRDRVLQYIEKNNYKPNVIARSLAQSKTYNIALVLPGDYNLVDLPFFQKCMLGISEVAASMDYDVVVTMVSMNDISQLERLVLNNKVDGVILSRTLLNDIPAEFLKKKKVPFVTIGISSDNSIIQIDNDHRHACHELTSILLMQGYRKIGLIGGSRQHIVTQSRYQGYLDAFREQGLFADADIIFFDVENVMLTEQIVTELISRQTDCIICMDDSICSHVLNKLRQENISVPKDIKIASFYNSSLLENNQPSITSLQFDVHQLGRITCKTLLDYIDGKEIQGRTLLGYEVILKESTKKDKYME